jgi:hypothetical protein
VSIDPLDPLLAVSVFDLFAARTVSPNRGKKSPPACEVNEDREGPCQPRVEDVRRA